MLRMLASKQESHVAARKPAVCPAFKPPQISNTGIQRKAECACGGGCPRCSAHGLPMSQPGDALEREADRKADHVLRNVDPEALSEKQTPQQVTQLFGSYFNTDFSNVRLHTNERAAASAKALGARAFTVGSDITFARDQFAPHTAEGRKLLAHEFAHVVQQRNAPKQIQRQDDGATLVRPDGIPFFLNCTKQELDNNPDTSCCSRYTRTLIPGLYNTSREYIGRAITRMESGVNVNRAIRENFGAGAPSARAEILERLKLIQTELGRESQHVVACRIAQGYVGLDFEVNMRKNLDRRFFCDFGVLATGTSGGNVATLCVNSKGEPAGGWDTLLHEMVHISGVGNLPDRSVATPEQMTSGEFETYKGEETYPNPGGFSLRNADSYSSFVKTVGAASWTPHSRRPR